MGEAQEYMEMMAEQEQEALSRAQAEACAKANTDAIELERLLQLPPNQWQPGCPFKLKDVVFHNDLKECMLVVGLPTVGDVGTWPMAMRSAWARRGCTWSAPTSTRGLRGTTSSMFAGRHPARRQPERVRRHSAPCNRRFSTRRV